MSGNLTDSRLGEAQSIRSSGLHSICGMAMKIAENEIEVHVCWMLSLLFVFIYSIFLAVEKKSLKGGKGGYRKASAI